MPPASRGRSFVAWPTWPCRATRSGLARRRGRRRWTRDTAKPAVAGWLDKQKIALPVGQASLPADKAKKFLLDLGVGGVPWLILTDGKHVVTAEGFNLSEIDARLGAADEP